MKTRVKKNLVSTSSKEGSWQQGDRKVVVHNELSDICLMHVLRYSDYAKNRQNETILRRNLEIAYNKLSSRRQPIGRGERLMRPQRP